MRGAAVVAAIHHLADGNGEYDRQHGETRRDDADPDDGNIELERAVGGAHAHKRNDHLHENGVKEERDKKPDIDVVVVLSSEQG